MSLISLGYLLLIPAKSFGTKNVIEEITQIRPTELEVLIQRTDLDGEYFLGIYSITNTKTNPYLRRFKLWEERYKKLKIYSESVSCSPEEPIRVKRDGKAIYVRRLNPGGLITSSNKEDHLVWWAACVPELTGINPSNLKEKALELGYSLQLVESEEVLLTPQR